MIPKRDDDEDKCRLDIVSSLLLLFFSLVSLVDLLAILHLPCPASALSHVSDSVAITDPIVILIIQSGRNGREDRLILVAELIVFRKVRRQRSKVRLIVSHIIGILILIVVFISGHLRIALIR